MVATGSWMEERVRKEKFEGLEEEARERGQVMMSLNC